MRGSGKRGMRTHKEARIDREHLYEGMEEEKPRDNASKWFKHKAYDVGKKKEGEKKNG